MVDNDSYGYWGIQLQYCTFLRSYTELLLQDFHKFSVHLR